MYSDDINQNDTNFPLTAPIKQDDGSEWVFIEDNVPGFHGLIEGIKPGVRVVLLDHTSDGLQQMLEALKGVSGLKVIHLVSHGASGQLDLGTVKLTADTLNNHAEQLWAVGSALATGGDLLLYGCDVGQDLSFVEGLASLTGRDVAASNDLTGNAGKGGDWVLETQTGHIEAAVAFDESAQASYGDVLAIEKLIEFSAPNSLTGYFTPASDNSGSYTWTATSGLSGGGGISISSGSDQVWTSKDAYTMAVNGVYRVSAFFKSSGGGLRGTGLFHRFAGLQKR